MFLPPFPGAWVWCVSNVSFEALSNLYFGGIFTCDCDIYGHWCLPFGDSPFSCFGPIFLFHFIFCRQHGELQQAKMFSQISLVASDFFCATSNLYKCERYSTSVTMMLIILSNPTRVSLLASHWIWFIRNHADEFGLGLLWKLSQFTSLWNCHGASMMVSRLMQAWTNK